MSGKGKSGKGKGKGKGKAKGKDKSKKKETEESTTAPDHTSEDHDDAATMESGINGEATTSVSVPSSPSLNPSPSPSPSPSPAPVAENEAEDANVNNASSPPSLPDSLASNLPVYASPDDSKRQESAAAAAPPSATPALSPSETHSGMDATLTGEATDDADEKAPSHVTAATSDAVAPSASSSNDDATATDIDVTAAAPGGAAQAAALNPHSGEKEAETVTTSDTQHVTAVDQRAESLAPASDALAAVAAPTSAHTQSPSTTTAAALPDVEAKEQPQTETKVVAPILSQPSSAPSSSVATSTSTETHASTAPTEAAPSKPMTASTTNDEVKTDETTVNTAPLEPVDERPLLERTANDAATSSSVSFSSATTSTSTSSSSSSSSSSAFTATCAATATATSSLPSSLADFLSGSTSTPPQSQSQAEPQSQAQDAAVAMKPALAPRHGQQQAPKPAPLDSTKHDEDNVTAPFAAAPVTPTSAPAPSPEPAAPSSAAAAAARQAMSRSATAAFRPGSPVRTSVHPLSRQNSTSGLGLGSGTSATRPTPQPLSQLHSSNPQQQTTSSGIGRLMQQKQKQQQYSRPPFTDSSPKLLMTCPDCEESVSSSEMDAHVRSVPHLQAKVANLERALAMSNASAAAATTISTPSGDKGADYAFATNAASASTAVTPSDLSALSLAFFPELEPLLGRIPPPSSNHIYLAASVYVHDSFHCRSIQHETSYESMRSYAFLHITSRWKMFVRIIVWLHLLLGFVEPPSSIMLNGQRYGPSHAVCGAIELFCLAIYAIHGFLQYRAYGRGSNGFWRSPWRGAKVVVLVLCLIDVIVSMSRDLDSPAVHPSQLLRAFFVLEHSGRMRQLCSCIARSLPEILSIMFLCALHCFIFGVAGFLFVAPLESVSDIEGGPTKLYFNQLSTAFVETFIMLTSENFPEIMFPSYRKHWFVCIYFVLFVIIGLYMLLQLTTAVVFHSFQLHTKNKLQRALAYRDRAMQAAFTLLSEYTCGEGVIDCKTWKELLKRVRPDWTDKEAEILFQAATAKEGEEEDGESNAKSYSSMDAMPEFQLDSGDSDSASSSSSSSSESGMNYLQFEQILRFTQRSFQFKPSHARHHRQISCGQSSSSSSSPPPPPHQRLAEMSPRLHVSIPMGSDDAESRSSINAERSTALLSPSYQRSHGTINGDLIRSPSSAGTRSRHSRHTSSHSSSSSSSQQAPCFRQRVSAALKRALITFFTWRVAIPHGMLTMMGRTDARIAELESEEAPLPDDAQPSTPIHPLLPLRTRLTTFSVSHLLADAITVTHAIILVVQMALSSNDPHHSAHMTLRAFLVLFEVLFVLEIMCKMFVCGSAYFKKPLLVLDLVTVITVWVAQIVLWTHSYHTVDIGISCLRVARCFRLYHHLASFTLLLRVLGQVRPALLALFGVLFLFLYAYSIVGMMFFCDALQLGRVPEDIDYHRGDFYAMNFNDLAHSLIALFYQLVVNDWWVLMEAVVLTTGRGGYIFFISFYTISVLIVFSVCTAFVVEAYMDMHEQNVIARRRAKAASELAAIESEMSQMMTIPNVLSTEVSIEATNESNEKRKAAARAAAASAAKATAAAVAATSSNPGNNSMERPTATASAPANIPSANTSGSRPSIISVLGGSPHFSPAKLNSRPQLERASKSFRQFHAAAHGHGQQQRLSRQSSMRTPTGGGSGTPGGGSMGSGTGSSRRSILFPQQPGTPTHGGMAIGSSMRRGTVAAHAQQLSSSAIVPSHVPTSSSAVSTPPPLSRQSSTSTTLSSSVASSSESLLLSRIRSRATSQGMRVQLKPSEGMVSALTNMFAGQLDEESEEMEEGDESEMEEEEEMAMEESMGQRVP